MNRLGDLIGEACRIIFPIHEETFQGNPHTTIAICTLSSLDLLRKIANSQLMNQISIVGRLLSENNGIDEIIRYVNRNPKIKTIIVCGRDVPGHKPGHALFKLHKYGVDLDGKIINSISSYPYLSVTKSEIIYFQKEINLINLVNETDYNKIKLKII